MICIGEQHARGGHSCARQARRAGAVLLVLQLAFSGCSAGDVPSGAEDTTVVHNQSPGVWQQEGRRSWTLSEAWYIGGVAASGEDVFEGPIVVALGADGLIYVGDQGAAEVRSFAPDGSFVSRVARSGRGPGEVVQLIAVGWHPSDMLWVVTAGRYALFDEAARLIDELQRPSSRRPRRIEAAVFDRSGNFIDVEATTLADGSTGVRFVRVAPSGERVGVTPEIQAPIAFTTPPVAPGGGTETVMLPDLEAFRPKLIFAVSDDEYVWIADSDQYRLTKLSMHGDTLLVVHANHRRYGLTSAEENDLLARLRTVGWDLSTTRYGRQILQSMHILPDGSLVVQIETKLGENGRELDVFAPDGQFMGTIEARRTLDRDTPWSIRGDTILAVTRDSFDVGGLVRLHLDRM